MTTLIHRPADWEPQAKSLGRTLLDEGWPLDTLMRLARQRSIQRAQRFGFSRAEAKRLSFVRWAWLAEGREP